MTEHQALMYGDAFKERFVLPGALVTVPIEGFLNDGWIVPFHVMVSVDHIESFLGLEFPYKPEYMAMCSPYILKSSILPQLIPIPELNIGEPFIIVIIQGIKKEALIMGKIICPAIVTPVTVAQEYELGGIVKRDFLC
jgi:hypothetical protein